MERDALEQDEPETGPPKPIRKDAGSGRPEEETSLRKLGLFAVIVGDLVGYSGAGLGLGYLAWSKWDAPWWVLLLGGVSGMTLAFYKIYRIGQREL